MYNYNYDNGNDNIEQKKKTYQKYVMARCKPAVCLCTYQNP